MADKTEFSKPARRVVAGEFEHERHYYPRVLNAQIHPTVANFLALSTERLITRYCHMNPRVSPEALGELFNYQPRWFAWAGADLFHVATAQGQRQMVIIETNSCPSGQKSMPLRDETSEEGGYALLMERTFLPIIKSRRLPPGDLAVIYDKNPMENTGYAAALASAAGEPVWLATFYADDPDPSVRFDDGVMLVRDDKGDWHPIRAAFRYVTQKPWNRIPLNTKTHIFNPTRVCVSGGRNKMLAAKAYDMFNAELLGSGLSIRTPETMWDVSHHEIPLWVKRLGGLAVVKNPYSNAGQGVWTITNQKELDDFMKLEQQYDQFIVQSLIGNYQWSSVGRAGRLYHIGTVPNKRAQTFCADLRMMVHWTDRGFRPLAIYARRARTPLARTLDHNVSSWEMLGTNLSVKTADGSWDTETQRLLLMDRRDFNSLGIGIDDLTEALVQTMLSVIAIDKLASELTNQKGRFRMKLFRSMDKDPALLDEIVAGSAGGAGAATGTGPLSP
ncbi:MAG: hypothetical protein KC503_25920 [Myxococcales bacterium]|nr:hypothetical protein [Myxococcales bacterium]